MLVSFFSLYIFINTYGRNLDEGRKLTDMLVRQKTKQAGETKEAKKSLRKREKEILCCEMCHARVRRTQMGKHLLSHYHCRVAGVNPCGPRARRFLLENMANVVRQCPFQCFSCRFYCNTEETFLRHWRSDLHAKTLDQVFSLHYDFDLRVQWNSFRINSVYFYLVSTYLKDARRYFLVWSISVSRSPAVTDALLATFGARTTKRWKRIWSIRVIATLFP